MVSRFLNTEKSKSQKLETWSEVISRQQQGDMKTTAQAQGFKKQCKWSDLWKDSLCLPQSDVPCEKPVT